MLELLYGPAGSGKTEYIFTQLQQCVQQDRVAVLLVPEQFSFENERALLSRYGVPIASRVQVLTFSRLADLVLSHSGGADREPLDELSSLLLTAEALRQTQDQLDLLRGYSRSADTVAEVFTAISECKNCAGDTARLAQTALQLPDGPLQKKLLELITVTEAFDALTNACNRIDPSDRLTLCAEKLAECGFADRADVFVDSFKGFTVCEERVLQALMKQAARLTVSLCTDTLSPVAPGERFYVPSHTGRRLLRLAQERGIPFRTEPLQRNEKGSAALRHIERHLLTAAEPPADAGDSLVLRVCENRRDEATQAVRFIRRYLRENGGRLRDVVIAVRHLENWQGLLDNALQRASLPYFWDARRSVLTEPLFASLLSALSCACNGFDTEELLRLAKIGLLCSDQEALSLENYCFTWSLRGKQWLSPFTAHPDGLEAPVTEQSTALLEQLEQTRSALVEPLLPLRLALQNGVDGTSFACAVTDYLKRSHVPQALEQLSDTLYQSGDRASAERLQASWDLCMQLLGRLSRLFGDTVSGTRMAEAFHLLAQHADLGSVPQSVDAVRIGQVDRIRYASPSLVLLLGVNEGEFPAAPADSGLLTDQDRVCLAQNGLSFNQDLLVQVSEEYFYAYAAAAAPHTQLYVSRCQQAEEQPCRPSALWNSLISLFPQHPIAEPLSAETAPEMFEELAYGKADAMRQALLRTLLQNDPDYAPSLSALQRAESRTADFSNRETAPLLLGKRISLSASQVEQYYQCPFSYFCKYEARLLPPRPAEVDSLLVGTLTHDALQRLLPQYLQQGFAAVSRPQIEQDVRVLIEERIARLPQQQQRRAQMEYCLHVARRNCTVALWRLVSELKDSAFVPIAFELPIGQPSRVTDPAQPQGVGAWRLPLQNGTSLYINGQIDRVDLYTDATGHTYVRIIDYKASEHSFSLRDVLYGLNLQMLIYLFALRNDKGRFAEAEPAGILYVTTTPGDLSPARREEEQTEQQLFATMRGGGLLLNDIDVVSAMEDPPGTFIRASLSKNGQLSQKGSVLANAQQIDALEQYVIKMLQQMGNRLLQGDVPAHPRDAEHCRRCPYQSVCGGIGAAPPSDRYDTDELWTKLGYSEQGGGQPCN